MNFEIRLPPNYQWKIKKSNSWPSLLDPCSCNTMERDGSRHIINGLEEFQRQSESQRLTWVLQSFTYQQFFRNNETINQHWQVLQRRRWHGKPHALHSYCTCGSGISLCYDYFNVFDIDRVSPMLPCKILHKKSWRNVLYSCYLNFSIGKAVISQILPVSLQKLKMNSDDPINYK